MKPPPPCCEAKSSTISASYYRQTAPKSVTVYEEMPPRQMTRVVGIAADDHHQRCDADRSIQTVVKEKNAVVLATLKGVVGIATYLKTHLQNGIEGDLAQEISRRTRDFGRNYVKPPTKSFFHFIWKSFKDPTILILLVCAALSLGFGIKQHGTKEGWYEGGSIFVAVFLVISVSAISDFRQSRQFDKLFELRYCNMSVEVVRNGRRQKILASEIVVGDVAFLSIGDQVPADGLFIDGYSFKVDESSLTGESNLVEIDGLKNPFLLSGTKVGDGWGTMLVTCVGINTSWGELMSIINRDSDEQTPLQARLNGLTLSIGKVGLAVAFLVLVVLLVRYFTGNTEDENGRKEFNGSMTKADDVIKAVVGIIAAAVTIVVVAIPEGLSLAVTLTLAYSMKRMMADRAMVRNPSACEAMASATTICTDKTGTLTLNHMKVTKFWQGGEFMEGRDCAMIARNVLELLHQGIGLSTTGSVISGTNLEFSGSPTEKAILSWAVLELNMDKEAVKRECNTLYVEAFSSEKKSSRILMKKVEDETCHVHFKGAAEIILAMCSHYYDAEGNVKALDGQERMRFDQIIQGIAASSLQCIAFAHKQVSDDAKLENSESQNKIQEKGLTLLGLVGLKNPCRPGVKKAVEDCQYAGVNVKMITGDNVFTAKAIATECGILGPNQEANDGSVVEGVEFRNYTPEERMEKVERIRVIARSSPFDKLLMVQCLKRKGHVVAVTGDGTNDAPALHEADIGLAMGIQGTEVAKESSDIVILDDNFASVAIVLRWGRCVYTNVEKVIQFQVTIIVAALIINVVAAASTGKSRLTPAQFLWVSLVVGSLGALALATGKPSKELMNRAPVNRADGPLISNIMGRNILGQVLYQMVVILLLMFKGKSIFGVHENEIDTLIFTNFLLLQVCSMFNARELEEKNVFKGVYKNKLFLGITVITFVLQVIMVELLNKFAHTERLHWKQWGGSIGISAFSLAIGAIVKFVPVPKRPILDYLIIQNRDSGESV